MMRLGTQKEGGTGTNVLGVGCIEAEQNLDVEIFGKQMEAQNCADQL